MLAVYLQINAVFKVKERKAQPSPQPCIVNSFLLLSYFHMKKPNVQVSASFYNAQMYSVLCV